MPGIKFFSQNFLFFSLVMVVSGQARAQEKNINHLGVLVAGEMEYGQVNPTVGFFYERKFTQRSGLETGLFFRTYQQDYFLTFNNDGWITSETVKVAEGFFTIPVLYRFSTNFATFSLGPQVDIFSIWNQKNLENISIEAYDRTPKIMVGPLLKVGKEFRYKESVIFEPELRFGVRALGTGNIFLGLGLKLKQEVRFKK